MAVLSGTTVYVSCHMRAMRVAAEEVVAMPRSYKLAYIHTCIHTYIHTYIQRR